MTLTAVRDPASRHRDSPAFQQRLDVSAQRLVGVQVVLELCGLDLHVFHVGLARPQVALSELLFTMRSTLAFSSARTSKPSLTFTGSSTTASTSMLSFLI